MTALAAYWPILAAALVVAFSFGVGVTQLRAAIAVVEKRCEVLEREEGAWREAHDRLDGEVLGAIRVGQEEQAIATREIRKELGGLSERAAESRLVNDEDHRCLRERQTRDGAEIRERLVRVETLTRKLGNGGGFQGRTTDVDKP